MPKQKHPNLLLSSVYYYTSLIVLGVAFIVVSYWQIQPDNTYTEITEFSITTTERNQSFYIPISFCTKEIQEFQIERYYFNTNERIYYSIPSATYLMAQERKTDGCFSTNLNASSELLAPGAYEYRIFISYDVNPIQKVRRQVALVHVTVE